MGKDIGQKLNAVASQEKLVGIEPRGQSISISGIQSTGLGVHGDHNIDCEFEYTPSVNSDLHHEADKEGFSWGEGGFGGGELDTTFMTEKELEIKRELQEERELVAFVGGAVATGVLIATGVLGYVIGKKRCKKQTDQ